MIFFILRNHYFRLTYKDKQMREISDLIITFVKRNNILDNKNISEKKP